MKTSGLGSAPLSEDMKEGIGPRMVCGVMSGIPMSERFRIRGLLAGLTELIPFAIPGPESPPPRPAVSERREDEREGESAVGLDKRSHG